MGRRALQNSKKVNALAPEQHGSLHSAIEHGVNKRLTFDIWRQSKCPGVLCSNDAKSCYDRILNSELTLALRRVGVAKAPLKCMLYAIQNLKHYVRTAYGDSTQCLDCQTLWEMVHGVGQGNGAGPTVWTLLSTPILNLLRNKNLGEKFRLAMTKEILDIVGYAFVDNTDLIQMAKQATDTLEDVDHNLQQALNWWEGGIKTTGGALVPDKTFWYGVKFRWEGTKWKYVKGEEE